MTYCLEFVHKFRKDGNFCGLSKSAAEQVEAWSDFISELADCGCDERRIVETLSSHSYNKSGMRLLKRTTPLWRQLIEKIAKRTAESRRITTRELREWINLDGMSTKELQNNLSLKGYSSFVKGKKLKEKSFFSNQIDMMRRPPAPTTRDDRRERQRKIQSICTVGQWNLLSHISMLGLADDEYGAFCLLFMWAHERPEVQKVICNGKIQDKPPLSEEPQ